VRSALDVVNGIIAAENPDMNSCLYQGVLRHRRLQPKRTTFAIASLWPGSIWMNWTARRRHPPQSLCRRLF
jgi:hypothetical protein